MEHLFSAVNPASKSNPIDQFIGFKLL
jgi:hypothetical protein